MTNDASLWGKPILPLPEGFVHLGGGFLWNFATSEKRWVEVHPFPPVTRAQRKSKSDGRR